MAGLAGGRREAAGGRGGRGWRTWGWAGGHWVLATLEPRSGPRQPRGMLGTQAWALGQTQRPSVMALVALVGSTVLFPLIFRASTWACLFCFTTHEERLRVCQMFAGTEGSKLGQCKDALTAAFEGLSDVEINYDERSHLHDAFTQMILSLQEVAAAQGSFKAAFPSAAAKMKRTIHHLKKVQDCILPCGVQEATRRFNCWGCFSTICDLPLDCPVQDVTVKRGHQALFSCIVGFQLPESELTYSWKFAAGAPDSGRVLLP